MHQSVAGFVKGPAQLCLTSPGPRAPPSLNPHLQGGDLALRVVTLPHLTETHAFHRRWINRLSWEYVRRADVVNRGFSGYTTRQVAEIVTDLLEPSTSKLARLAIVWLGANDAKLKTWVAGSPIGRAALRHGRGLWQLPWLACCCQPPHLHMAAGQKKQCAPAGILPGTTGWTRMYHRMNTRQT